MYNDCAKLYKNCIEFLRNSGEKRHECISCRKFFPTKNSDIVEYFGYDMKNSDTEQYFAHIRKLKRKRPKVTIIAVFLVGAFSLKGKKA